MRFMTGMKNESAMLTGSDILDPRESKINFACPSENYKNNRRLETKDKDGFIHQILYL